MQKPLIIFLAVVALGLIFISQAFFIVDESKQAIVLQLGQPVGDQTNSQTLIKGPGLHFKIPLIQDVRYFDRRILSLDPSPDEVVISSDRVERGQENEKTDDNEPSIDNVTGEPINVDTFARYKIVDPLQFMKTLRTVPDANSRLASILNSAARAELGSTTLKQLLSEDRARVMRTITDAVNKSVKENQFGVEIVDVRIVRADLTDDLRVSTVQRMNSELEERATETRAKGEERALEIRSTAEKEREVLLAEAQRDAQIQRGQGDNEAFKIYAKAFNKDKEFYSFIRSMEAYSKTLSDPNTKLILSPDSPFFKYFGTQGSKR